MIPVETNIANHWGTVVTLLFRMSLRSIVKTNNALYIPITTLECIGILRTSGDEFNLAANLNKNSLGTEFADVISDQLSKCEKYLKCIGLRYNNFDLHSIEKL